MKLPLTLFIAFQVCRLKARLASNVRTARQLRGSSNIFEKQVNSKVLVPSLYRVTIAGTFMTQTDGSIIEEERQVSCIPIVGFKETDELYPIKLPQTILVENHKAIASGQLFLSITNTELIQGEIMMTKDSNVSVILDPRLVSRDVGSSTSGIKSMAIVRISTNDASPQFNATALREGLFSPNKVNLKTQYSACSFGQLVWKLADAGVIEVLVDQPVSDFTSGSDLVTAAQATMKEKMGYATISDLADKVIMCLPPGTGNWVASSGVNFWRAQFNDEWCLSLTATMHETYVTFECTAVSETAHMVF